MRKILIYSFLSVLALIAVIGLSISIRNLSIKRHFDKYEARVAAKVITTDSASFHRALLDTFFIARYAELSNSNIEQYIDDWYNASKAHQSNKEDESLSALYDRVIEYYNRRADPQDVLYEHYDFEKDDIADSSYFLVVPEKICVHKLQSGDKEKEWYRQIEVYSDSISYDVPVIKALKPVLYWNPAIDSSLSNYLSWVAEWRDDSYYEERDIEKEMLLKQYIPVHEGGDIPGYYRLFSTPAIFDVYYYHKDILIRVRISSFYSERLLLRDGEIEFEVVDSIII